MNRHLLSDDWNDDEFDKHWDDAADQAKTAATISIGIIVAIVIGIIVFAIVSVVVCIYCVCKKRTFSSGTVVQRGQPQAQVTTYNFQSPPPQPVGPVTYPQYPQAVPGPQYQQYPPAGPPQAYPPAVAGGGGWIKPDTGAMAPPPYSQTVDYSNQQKASAPPLE